ncbi:MAG TPA: dephospho-CoA kinase [Iamia sp.]|jgi:dephospho-CoA kinase|nr:dephospho-CoA kinase [Iamia sp.]
MVLVGLTGGIGSGKSTVSALLADRGALVIDADAIVRDVQAPGTPVLAAIVERFGTAVLAPDGTLDRQALADVVFTDDEALAALNAIVHPAVGAEIARRLEEAAGTDRVVVLDVPLLVESGRDDTGAEPLGEATPEGRPPSSEAQPRKATPTRVPYSRDPLAALLVVDVDPEVAVERVVAQRGMREDDVRARIARQASREDRLARATLVIDNGGSRADLEAQVDAAWDRISALPPVG